MIDSDFIRIHETESINLEKDINLYRKIQRLKQSKIIKFAYKDYGITEIPGPKHNSQIVKYHLYTNLKAKDDETPYCSAALNYWMAENNVRGTWKANARSWLDWGIPLLEPEYGCVVIYWRGSAYGWMGHCGLFIERRGDFILTLGANQDNQVNVKPYSKNRLLGYRGIE